ncbi:uncharacterized protein BDV17DRAFT_292712 [Aspergillus undulatus]|uniref:uncharacterized protein n=1 Tax=Aspergillus undulatus TaxID=1810928 RepID=UPI003CCD3E95
MELNPELDAIDCTTVRDTVNACQAIAAAKGRKVRVNYIGSSGTFVQFLNELRFITDEESHHRRPLLLSNSQTSLECSDFCQGIEVPLDYSKTVGFNAKQAEAFDMLRSLADGVGLSHGPPGTGKSFSLIRVLLFILRHVLTYPNDRKQVMLVGLNHNVADDLALKMDEALQELFPESDIIVVRCHSMATEEALVKQHAAQHRKLEYGTRPAILDNEAIDGDAALN